MKATASGGETRQAAEVGAGAGASAANAPPARNDAKKTTARQIAIAWSPKAAIETTTRSRNESEGQQRRVS